jgi:YhcH/YjgK/YiaL family protein
MTFSARIILPAIALCAAVALPASGADRVKTANGIVESTVPPKDGVRSFKGIPFAQPPVGDLRWREPQPVKDWSGTRNADTFGPTCMQRLSPNADYWFRGNGMSEDCLYLNVWTPATSGREKLPVLVYIFGGGFQNGDGSERRYDGERMARKGIVAVSLNYRTNVFGFFVHPELTKESPHRASGNYGLLDQVAALQWVRRNIAAFGGDPGRVTIAGESAGSISVSALMASPLSRNLMAGAICESGAAIKTGTPDGPGLPPWPAYTPDTGYQRMRIDVQSRAEPEPHRDRYLALDAAARGARAAGDAVQVRARTAAVRGTLKDWKATPGIRGLERAFEYLAGTDLSALPLGRTSIDGDDLFVTVSEAETKPPDQVRFEAHRRYIDIQLVLRGQESIGVAPASSLTTVEPYDPARDIAFFAVPPESRTVELREGEFVVFEPGDGHRPSLHLDGPHVSRKAVVKISVAYRDRQRGGPPRP